MAISAKSRKILWGRSGNRCAICKTELVLEKDTSSLHLNIGEECHIISRQPNGPRYEQLENSEYNNCDNLLLLCSNDHKMVDEKIETYPQDKLYDLKVEHELWVKENLDRNNSIKKQEEVNSTLQEIQKIECASISIDSKNCSWGTYDNVINAFIDNRTDKSPFPILNFSFINHTSKTVLFTSIQLKAKHLSSGLSGIQQPQFLKSMIKFKIQVPSEMELTEFRLIDEIEVPSGQAFKFQVQLYINFDKKDYPIEGRKILFFTFKFNNNVSVTSPTIFLNCKNENEKMQIRLLT